ncbi:MAG: hypothetical protein M1812_000987 [Candelaria pacifica]|nr:MAG: hypothetical protein M1812_000987 [Candelaria pacifica]
MEGDQGTVIHVDVSRSHGESLSSEDDACVICLEKVSERAIAIPCRHQSFDFLCLVSWLQERKIEVEAVRYNFRNPEDFKTFLVSSTTQRTSGSSTSVVANPQHFREFRRTPVRRRPRTNQRPQSSNFDTVISRRRQIYSNQLYSLHVGSNRLSRFQDLTPELFRSDEDLISRARKWIRRELQVFEFLNIDSPDPSSSDKLSSNAEFLLEYIIAILKTVDVKGSGGQAEDMLQEFLGRDNTKLFLHELRAWLRTPYNSLEDWDRAVQYREAPLMNAGSLENSTKFWRAKTQHEAAFDHPTPVELRKQHADESAPVEVALLKHLFLIVSRGRTITRQGVMHARSSMPPIFVTNAEYRDQPDLASTHYHQLDASFTANGSSENQSSIPAE